MRPFNERGQYVPLTAMVMFAGVMLFVAGANVYKVAKAKLQVQNMADAAALAIAAMEAKEINVVIDRNEWLNHMYPDGTKKSPDQLPGISDASNWKAKTDNMANYYAQLVGTINKAQQMFMQAYERFMGADSGNSTLGNGDAGALKDVLSEIDGLNDPNVTVVVYNTQQDSKDLTQQAKAISQNGGANSSGGPQVLTGNMMRAIPIKTVPVTIRDKDGNPVTLTKLFYNLKHNSDLPPNGLPQIGWMRPDWDDARNMNMPGSSKKMIGAGVVVAKRVPLIFQIPLFRVVTVTASSMALVVQGSGNSVKNGSGFVGGTATPPDHFRPTYYVKLVAPK